MISLLATVITVVGIVTLFRLDPNVPRVSKAIWVPFVWLFIESSRPVSAWITLNVPGNVTNEYVDGSPLDRNVLTLLLLLGLYFLSKRGPQLSAILSANPALIIYFGFCLISLFWADYPFVVFKRWIRSIGDVVMVLIVITEQNRLDAFKRLFTRVGYFVVPWSILLIRFYPALGRIYSRGGVPEWTGVGTDKNALGAICMIYGVVLLWRGMSTYSKPKSKRRKQNLTAISVAMVMVLYLLFVVNSQTALACFAMSSSLIVITAWFAGFRRPITLTLMVIGMVGLCYSVLILGIGGAILELLGRNATLTGRTDVWNTLLAHAVNPWIGAGYENFWIGDRIQLFNRLLGGLNQAHNGYIEIYLNMGFVGLALLGGVIVAGYRNILKDLRRDRETARLKIAFFVMCLIYNFTEASFKMMSPVWFTFLWAVIFVPKPRLKSDLPAKAWQSESAIADEPIWQDAQHDETPRVLNPAESNA